jgi:glutamyl-tRNA reductase
MLFAFGVNHKTAPIEVREKLYIREEEIPALLRLLKETLSECIILSTCNRTEIYGVCDSAEVDLDYYKNLVTNFKNAADTVEHKHFFTLISCAACQQLFRVATSVDSKIIGDTQILQQLRNAYFLAKDSASTGKILNQLSQRAFKIGKKTYTETSIHASASCCCSNGDACPMKDKNAQATSVDMENAAATSVESCRKSKHS